MEKINESNPPYYISKGDGGTNVPVNCLDCMQIHILLQESYLGATPKPTFWSPLLFASINLDLMEVIFDKELTKKY